MVRRPHMAGSSRDDGGSCPLSKSSAILLLDDGRTSSSGEARPFVLTPLPVRVLLTVMAPRWPSSSSRPIRKRWVVGEQNFLHTQERGKQDVSPEVRSAFALPKHKKP